MQSKVRAAFAADVLDEFVRALLPRSTSRRAGRPVGSTPLRVRTVFFEAVMFPLHCYPHIVLLLPPRVVSSLPSAHKEFAVEQLVRARALGPPRAALRGLRAGSHAVVASMASGAALRSPTAASQRNSASERVESPRTPAAPRHLRELPSGTCLVGLTKRHPKGPCGSRSRGA